MKVDEVAYGSRGASKIQLNKWTDDETKFSAMLKFKL